jgi:hypothetical protein
MLGILDCYGTNWLAVEIWARQPTGARLGNFSIVAGTPVLTSYGALELLERPSWSKREGGY